MPPQQVMAIQKQFERAYFAKYNSRVIQFLYDESSFTLEYVVSWDLCEVE